MNIGTIVVDRDSTLKVEAEKRGIEFSNDFTLDDLINFRDNKKRIEQNYIDQRIGEEATPDYIAGGTVIHYPTIRVNRAVALASGHDQGKVLKPNEFRAFYSENFKRLSRDERYTPVPSGIVGNNAYIKVKNEYNVLIWSRTFGADGEEGRLLNVTPFVSSVTTTESVSGGTFSIDLGNPSYTFAKAEGYTLDSDTLLLSNEGGQASYYSKQSIVNRNHATTPPQVVPFFDLTLNANDVVFIQFEPLKIEYDKNSLRNRLDQGNLDVNSLWVDPSEMVGATWDMIGLIDVIAGNVNANSTVTTTVQGRDLSKLIDEDSTYYFSTDAALGVNGFAGQRNTLNGFDNLRDVGGRALLLDAKVSRSVAFHLGLIFNQMTNVRIFEGAGPFAGYTTDINEPGLVRRTYERIDKSKQIQEVIDSIKSYKPSENDSKAPSPRFDTRAMSGIWRGVRVIVEPSLAERHIINSSIATARGSMRNFVDMALQEPFAEFFSQTWGDKHYFIARTPPFTKRAILDHIQNGLVLDIEEYQVEQYEFAFDENEVRNWFYVEHAHSTLASNHLLAFLPSGFIERQAKRYGVSASHIVSNYVGFRFEGSNTTPAQIDNFRAQAAADLAFLIETQACLPYTRMGTFVLSGDRRVRAGMFIRFKATNEIGYVTATSNVASDSANQSTRSTVVNVERLMVEDHLEKYFDIAKLNEEKRSINDNSSDKTEIKYTVTSNDDTIDFFEKKRQFIKSQLLTD